MADGVDFCTLGMFIIDEIHFRPPRPPVADILGGAGSYAALGARLCSPPPQSRKVGWIVDAGHDFPKSLRDVLAGWQTRCLVRETPWRQTTRGWNGYDERQVRAFRYTTPKQRLDERDLDTALLGSKSFHLICSPKRAMELVSKISRRQAEELEATAESLWVWEPVPDLCTVEEMDNCKQALSVVDVISPNHSELCAFFGKSEHLSDGSIDVATVESCCRAWTAQGIGRKGRGCVIVRAGKDGCLVAQGNTQKWLPAYHQDAARVEDPTGGGNTFCGAVAVSLARHRRAWETDFKLVVEAAIAGNAAASFAIEQVGVPTLTLAGDNEQWNGHSMAQRQDELKSRMSSV